MGDVFVENLANHALPHRKQMPSSIPNIDSLEGLGTDGSDEYSTLKKLQRHLEYVLKENEHSGMKLTNPRYIQLQEEYIKDEQR
jgi:26S proteasome regulatory subunit T3